MEIKDIICNELEEQGEIKVSELREKVFPGSPEMLEELDEKLDRYNLSYETVAPKNEQTIKKFQKQKLYTDTGASRSRSRWKNTEIPTMWSLSPTWTGQSRC